MVKTLDLYLPYIFTNIVIFYFFLTLPLNTLPVCSCVPKEKPSIVIEMTRFEAWSKGAWTDVFLQIYKVTFPGLFTARVFWLVYMNNVLVKV